MRWHEQYRVGDTVEALFYYASGPVWARALVVRKTHTGHPIVRHINSKVPGCTIISVARDIRKPERPEHPWARNLEANVY